MLISFSELRRRLKGLGPPVYQDGAPKNSSYPYFVYTFTNEENVHASGQTTEVLPEYQISLFTLGTIADTAPFRAVFTDVPYAGFRNNPSDENGHTINNFYTYVRVKADE